MWAPKRQHLAEESIETLVELTIRRGDALLLIQHQLLHLFPQVLLVDGRRIKSVTHKLGHSGTRRHLLLLFFFFLRWLRVTQTAQKLTVLLFFFFFLLLEGLYENIQICICTHTSSFAYLLYVTDGNWRSFWPDFVYKKNQYIYSAVRFPYVNQNVVFA